MLQLRLYGATLTRNARGTLGVDPLLVAAPAIGLVGGAVLAIRIVPRLAELARAGAGPDARADRLARRPPGRPPSAPVHAGRAAADPRGRPGNVRVRARRDLDPEPGRPGGVDRPGRDVRMSPGPASDIPAWALGGALRSIPGVGRGTPVVKAAVDLGSTIRSGTLVAIDGAAMADVVRLRDDAAGATTLAAPASPGGPASAPHRVSSCPPAPAA